MKVEKRVEANPFEKIGISDQFVVQTIANARAAEDAFIEFASLFEDSNAQILCICSFTASAPELPIIHFAKTTAFSEFLSQSVGTFREILKNPRDANYAKPRPLAQSYDINASEELPIEFWHSATMKNIERVSIITHSEKNHTTIAMFGWPRGTFSRDMQNKARFLFQYFAYALFEKFPKAITNPNTSNSPDSLKPCIVNDGVSDREAMILLLRANGKSSDQISSAMGFSQHTIMAYQESACAKLQTKDLPHAVARAIKLGLIDTNDIA